MSGTAFSSSCIKGWSFSESSSRYTSADDRAVAVVTVPAPMMTCASCQSLSAVFSRGLRMSLSRMSRKRVRCLMGW